MNEFIPSEFYLGQNYPNPFKERTTIKYCVPTKAKVRLFILNSEGDLVRELENEVKHPGTYQVEFSVAEGIDSGIFFCHLEAGNYRTEKKMILLK